VAADIPRPVNAHPNTSGLRRGHPPEGEHPKWTPHKGQIQEHIKAKRAREAEAKAKADAEVDALEERAREDPAAQLEDTAVVLARITAAILRARERLGGALTRDEVDTLRELRQAMDQLNTYLAANRGLEEARAFLREMDGRIDGYLERLLEAPQDRLPFDPTPRPMVEAPA
jgi:acyl-CoA reductase-like NAD-dependent aldehyde dehydrogenase